jgi:hypothetical protein
MDTNLLKHTGALGFVAMMEAQQSARDEEIRAYYRSLPRVESAEHKKLREERKKKRNQKRKSKKINRKK